MGFTWVWRAAGSNTVWVIADRSVPTWVLTDVVRSALAWARLALERAGLRGVADVRCGFWSGWLHRLVEGVVGAGLAASWGTLMVYSGGASSYAPPSSYGVRLCSPGDATSIARVVNRAFSQYVWWHLVSPEDVLTRLRRAGAVCYVAVDEGGDVVGCVDASIYTALDGGLTADVGLLAVDPGHQGRGLGKALVSAVIEALARRGVRRVGVDSASGLEAFYRSLGFRECRRWVTVRVPVPALPQSIPTLEEWGS